MRRRRPFTPVPVGGGATSLCGTANLDVWAHWDWEDPVLDDKCPACLQSVPLPEVEVSDNPFFPRRR
jgi:hypothetical protein